jgi:alpha-tubulin suppressor-like RCC1 family protein
MLKTYWIFLFLQFSSILFSQQCWKSIDADNSCAFAIKSDGTLWGWGEPTHLGLDSFNISSCQLVPKQIGRSNNWRIISFGKVRSLAIKTDGSLWSWGEYINGPNTYVPVPTRIGTANNWQSVAAGTLHSVAIKTDGTLWVWGQNDARLGLGNDSGPFVLNPTQIGSANNWKSISVRGCSNMAIKTDGTLWAWGCENDYGQLGDGTYFTRNIPTQVGTATNWQTVEPSLYHTLGVKTDGTLWAWGTYLSLGIYDGTYASKNSPTQVGTANNWQSISANSSHSVAIKKDGTLWAWGYNTYGQLGNNTNIDKYVPTQIGVANNWLSAKAGDNYTIALKNDGTLSTWGSNDLCQLGDSTKSNKNVPVLLKGCPISMTTGIVQTEFLNFKMVLYPNPFSDNFILSVDTLNFINAKITVFNTVGQIVKQINMTKTSEFIDVSEQPNGLYFLQLKLKNNILVTQKVQKL